MIDAAEKDLFSSYCEKHGVMHVRRWQLNRKSFLKEETNKYEAMFLKKKWCEEKFETDKSFKNEYCNIVLLLFKGIKKKNRKWYSGNN